MVAKYLGLSLSSIARFMNKPLKIKSPKLDMFVFICSENKTTDSFLLEETNSLASHKLKKEKYYESSKLIPEI